MVEPAMTTNDPLNTDSILARLRDATPYGLEDSTVLRDAIDTIERLRQYIDELREDRFNWVKVAQRQEEEIERLRSALDAEGNDTNLLMLEIERLRAELSAFVRWGEWLTVEGLCYHSSDEPCTRTDHMQHPMFVRWEARRG